ncbi:hypothetical protein FOYG_16999 [Fusarium oxysporum NRRL 32931]|uniref:C2H2-type domain-containing protein n=1 Tax=Fusarium oxysporum NRRL 32931 TaxID=660029 RepID=W9HB81_FUSOX|nr:hypothetical protein FOYG_16999 [Fusarium oxysporum NRRL 32931]
MGQFVPPTPGERSGDEGSKEKQRCTWPDCGKIFKDLKANMLTHQIKRPEKCPIQTCEYHIKGFARKHGKNRHTLIMFIRCTPLRQTPKGVWPAASRHPTFPPQTSIFNGLPTSVDRGYKY